MIGGLLAAAPASQQHPALQTLPDVPWDRRTKASPAEKHCAEMNKLYSLLPRVCLSVCSLCSLSVSSSPTLLEAKTWGGCTFYDHRVMLIGSLFFFLDDA